ncbi:MAG: LysR family transcriptional regulator [Gudongella sp.]|nr:LysR family transcriptional regulator [Gudongella sp.]
MIKLDLYSVFNEVAKTQNFTIAAKLLFVSQPAVSQSISQLESDLGTRLFTRTSKGVHLTSEGKLLYEYTHAGISLIKNGEQRLIDSKNLLIGQLRIGVGDTISRYYLIDYLERFNSIYPKIKLRIINKTTLELVQMIKSGEIDLGVCNLPIYDKSLQITPIEEIQDIFVAGDKFKELKNKTISFKDLENYPLIMLDKRSRTRQYLESFLIGKAVNIVPEIELGSHDLLLEFAKIGLGIACVVKEYSYEQIKKNELFQVRTMEEIPKRSIGVCTLSGVALSPAAKRFADILIN